MPPVTAQELPLHPTVVMLGAGVFVLVFGLMFCCFFLRKLRLQARDVSAGFRMVVFGDALRVHERAVTCAVCLEDFRPRDELGLLPCRHAFHKRCLLKWLEVRCACPMCNSAIGGAPGQTHEPSNLLDELL